MAIEIKELHLNLHLGKGEKSSSSPKSGSGNLYSDISEKEALLDQTVREVLKVLKEQEDR